MKKIKLLLINLVLMFILVAAVLWGVFYWLNIYTRHADVVEIPEITGMTIEEASEALAQRDLLLAVTDSVFNTRKSPGIILETTPTVGSKIKRERTVFVIVNATGTLKRQIPAVQEVSLRQAMASLRAAGFENISVKYVGGAHNDLVLAIKTADGRLLRKGDNIPYNTPIVLEVSLSDPSLMMTDDPLQEGEPLMIEETEDENWF
ncbi:PASTA domain-containing protein [Porphyromonas sp.]|uniref:PASTA domain-containing protein n=1 Tax=Porphyromonas sp. TaxID=1924944 RepID=UPI0026DAE91D|nr:PASTA domain-containing protein [Porphyromonas sp.]MDO4770392.1 PASTA domain-containing protein [Porphyromonas sp.]